MPAQRTAARPPASGRRPAPPSRSASGKRPVVSAREAQALREALALRQVLAARPDLTPEQVAALRAAVAPAVRSATPGTRQQVRRTAPARRPGSAAGRPAARRAPARKPTSRTRPERRPDEPRTRWSTRLGVVAMSTLLLPAVASLAMPGQQDAGQNGGPLDATTLALTARSSLLEQAGRYRQVEQEIAAHRAQLEKALVARQAAQEQVHAEQQVVGTTAAALYRAPAADRYPLLQLDVNDDSATSAALYQQALADRADHALEGAVIRAERTGTTLADADEHVAAAQAAVEAADRRAAGVLAAVRAEVEDLSPEVTGVLAGLGTIPAAGAQQDRNQAALTRWQTYLGELAAGGIEPPPAADLADDADLPAGMSPALDADGLPVPGVAWAVVGNRPVTVLSAETVAAVSNALSQLGKPYVAGTSGPETYDCGGFTSAAWLVAGYAVPPTPQDQWATGAPVPLDGLQIGDLVFSPGGQDVGIYLGQGDVLGASAGSYQVAVRSVAAGSSAVRVTLPAPAEPNAALPPGGETGLCGAALPAPGVVSPAWGGWSNGQIPVEALCALGAGRHALRCDAATSYAGMSAAYEAAFGTPLVITDSYRSLGAQVAAFYRKPALAAVPGTSNHGWALAVDLGGGINVAGSPQWTWMTAHAGRFGFVQPEWARPGGEKPEPWHWEYGYIS